MQIQHVWNTSNNRDNWNFTQIKLPLQKPTRRMLHTEITGSYSNNCDNPGNHVNKLYGRGTKTFILKVVRLETIEM